MSVLSSMECSCAAHVLTVHAAPRADADPERVLLIPDAFDDLPVAAAAPPPARQRPGLGAERPAAPAAMRAVEPAHTEVLANAAAPGAAAAVQRASCSAGTAASPPTTAHHLMAGVPASPAPVCGDTDSQRLARMRQLVAAQSQQMVRMQRQLAAQSRHRGHVEQQLVAQSEQMVHTQQQLAAQSRQMAALSKQTAALVRCMADGHAPARLRTAQRARAEPSATPVPGSAVGGRPVQGGSGAAAGGSGAAGGRTPAAHLPPAAAASEEAALAFAQDAAAGLKRPFPQLQTLASCVAFYKVYACDHPDRPALKRMGALTGGTAWRSYGNMVQRWCEYKTFGDDIEQGLPRNDDWEVGAEAGLAAAARLDRLRQQLPVPTFVEQVLKERAAAKKAAAAARAAAAAAAVAPALAAAGAGDAG